MIRRFVNLVVQNPSTGVNSLRRLNPYKHLFYQSADEAAAANAKNEETQTLALPDPVVSFASCPAGLSTDDCPDLDLFALLGPRRSEVRIVNTNMAGDTVLYDTDERLFVTLPCLNEPKGSNPVCLSVAHPGSDEDSLYVMDRRPGEAVHRYRFKAGHTTSCFEVLEYVPRCSEISDMLKVWRWRLLPPPPFIHRPGYQDKLSSITSYATVVNADGCSTICISRDGEGIGTYCFDTARLDSNHRLGWRHSEQWRHVGEWTLPFEGRAIHVPEFNLWFGFSLHSPNHLCALDLLSAMDQGRQPTLQYVWEDLNPPDEEEWLPLYHHLVNLGAGRFCIAKAFDAFDTIGEHFAVLAGVEIVRGDDQSLRMVKHKSTRFSFTDDSSIGSVWMTWLLFVSCLLFPVCKRLLYQVE